MFGWFKRRSASATEREGSVQIAEVEKPAATEPAIKAATVAAPPPTPPQTAPMPVVNGHQPARRLTASRTAVPPRGFKEPAPVAGMVAVEVAPARVREAVVMRVAADGRRVMARIGGTTRTIWYTRRKDGTYRLESTPNAKAPRLVLGLNLTAQNRGLQIRLPH